MEQFSNAMQIFKYLNKTNCKECGEATCLAFAGAVFTGKSELMQCPHLPDEAISQFGLKKQTKNPIEEEFLSVIKGLQKGLATLDFKERAKTIEAVWDKGDKEGEKYLTLKILGKPFSIDKQGNVKTDLHVNSWVLGTVLHYVNHCRGIPLSSRWVPLRELPSGKDWGRFFNHQCEKVLKETADSYPDLFADLVDIFSGKQLTTQFNSDIAVVLYPLPLVPMLICYWEPEDGMESSLNLFFDDTAEYNLGMDGLYTVGVGIAEMLKRLAQVHGKGHKQ